MDYKEKVVVVLITLLIYATHAYIPEDIYILMKESTPNAHLSDRRFDQKILSAHGTYLSDQEDPVKPNFCQGKNNGDHGNPTDCKRYVRCFFGMTINAQCAPGMEWDKRQKKCMPPSIAQCSIKKNKPGCNDYELFPV